MKRNGIYLGFDFGTRHIGVAAGQKITQSANGITTLKAQEGLPDWEALDSLINEWQPEALVVGNPLNMDGSESEFSQKAKKFVNRLQDRYHLPVFLTDERLTSWEAEQSLKDKSLQFRQKKSTKSKQHTIAAAIFLTQWLQTLSD